MSIRNMIILAVIWCIVVFPNAGFYFFNKDAKLKRKIHPWWMYGIGFVMMCATLWLERGRMSAGYALVIVAINAAFSFYYSKAVVFCDNCGKTLFRIYPFQKTVDCSCSR